jgi:hypothetical protein
MQLRPFPILSIKLFWRIPPLSRSLKYNNNQVFFQRNDNIICFWGCYNYTYHFEKAPQLHTPKVDKCLSSENRQHFLIYGIFLEYESFCICNLHTDISLEMYASAHVLEFKNMFNNYCKNVVPAEHM